MPYLTTSVPTFVFGVEMAEVYQLPCELRPLQGWCESAYCPIDVRRVRRFSNYGSSIIRVYTTLSTNRPPVKWRTSSVRTLAILTVLDVSKLLKQQGDITKYSYKAMQEEKCYNLFLLSVLREGSDLLPTLFNTVMGQYVHKVLHKWKKHVKQKIDFCFHSRNVHLDTIKVLLPTDAQKSLL
jgi:hypothetical protein